MTFLPWLPWPMDRAAPTRTMSGPWQATRLREKAAGVAKASKAEIVAAHAAIAGSFLAAP